MASAKDRILDSFEDILIKEGERAATMDAVAAAAGVSKGGLLYHFPSKEAMVEGLCARLAVLTAEDAEKIGKAPEGAARYYVRTSLYMDSPLDRAIVAVARLVQQGHPAAAQTFAHIEALWLDALEKALGSRPVAQAIKLMGGRALLQRYLFRGGRPARQGYRSRAGSAAGAGGRPRGTQLTLNALPSGLVSSTRERQAWVSSSTRAVAMLSESSSAAR